jgi:hypothetical protein
VRSVVVVASSVGDLLEVLQLFLMAGTFCLEILEYKKSRSNLSWEAVTKAIKGFAKSSWP